MRHIKYKTTHNFLFRHIWFVVSIGIDDSLGETRFVVKNALGRTFSIPVQGTIIMLGKGVTYLGRAKA